MAGEGVWRRRGRAGEAAVMGRQIDLAQPSVGGLDIVDAGLRQLLDQTILQRAEHALRATPGLRRIGGNVLDAQPLERPADLRQPAAIDRLAGLGGDEVMAAAVGVETERHAHSIQHLTKTAKLRSTAYLLPPHPP